MVIECVHIDEDLGQERMLFRVMFNTAFIQSNVLLLSREDVDVVWDANDRFLKEFKAEVTACFAYFGFGVPVSEIILV